MKALWALSGLMLPFVLGMQSAIAQVTLNINSTYAATALDLDGQGNASTHIVKVADLHIATDNAQGFTLTITPDRLTKVNGTDIEFEVVTVADGESSPSTSAFTVSSGHNYTYSTDQAGAGDRDLYIRYIPHIFQDPGVYIAAIQITVINN